MSFKSNLTKFNVIKNIKNCEHNLYDIFQSSMKDNTYYYGNHCAYDYVYYMCNFHPQQVINIFSTICKDIIGEYKITILNDILLGKFNFDNIISYWNEYKNKTNPLYVIMNKMSSFSMHRHKIFMDFLMEERYNGGTIIHYHQLITERIVGYVLNEPDNRCESILSLINCVDMTKIFKRSFDIVNFNLAELFDKNEHLVMNKTVMYINNLMTKNDFNKDMLVELLYLVRDFNSIEIFEMYYTKYLTCRFLANKYNIETEQFVMNKIDMLFGTKLNLIDDIIENNKFNKEYKEIEINIASEKYKKFAGCALDKFEPKIVKMFRWKFINNNEIDINLPVEAQYYIDTYTKFYKHVRSDRRIIWKYDIGDGIISFKGADRNYKLELMTPQMLIMLYLNNNSMTIDELCNISNIDDNVIRFIINGFIETNIVVSLAHGKYMHNPNFSNESDTISLIKYMNGAPPFEHQITNIKSHIYNDISGRFLMFLEENKIADEKKCILYLNEIFGSDMTNHIKSVILQLLIKNVVIRIKDKDIYTYHKHSPTMSSEATTKQHYSDQLVSH